MDMLTRELQDEISWCVLSADDIVQESLCRKLYSQREELEKKDFKNSCVKTKYVICNFSPKTKKMNIIMMIEGVEVTKHETFHYLRSKINNGGIKEERDQQLKLDG